MGGKCFISHASEDKDSLARPLAHQLKRLGVNIWFDEFTLRPGDSLRRSIDRGLTDCYFGIVVLSPSFFAKEWPQRELNALLAGEAAGSKKILPIWHNVDFSYISRFSALLADRIAIKSKVGVKEVEKGITELLPDVSKIDNQFLTGRLTLFLSGENYVFEYLRAGIKHRFFKLQAFYAELDSLRHFLYEPLSDDQISEQELEIEAKLEVRQRELEIPFELPRKLKFQGIYQFLQNVFVHGSMVSMIGLMEPLTKEKYGIL